MTEAGTECTLALVRQIEERAFNAWPAEQTWLMGGWVLRLASGYTKRANSLNALQPEVRVEDVLAHARGLCSARGLPLILRVTPLAGDATCRSLADAALGRADDSLVLTVGLPLAGQIASGGDGVGATLVLKPRVDAAWIAGYGAAVGGGSAHAEAHRRLLEAIPAPAAFACLSMDGEPAAFGVAVVERGMAGVFEVATLPSARRRGAARALMLGLLAWAHDQGCRTAYLQVGADNAGAIHLYRQLGFAEAYRYHYRIAGV